MATQRWRSVLIEATETLPALWRPPRAEPEQDRLAAPRVFGLAALVAALHRLAQRGDGPSSWAAPLSEDPLAFLLDAISAAINLWDANGRLLYRNRASAELDLGWPEGTGIETLEWSGRQLERRCLRFSIGSAGYILDVVGPSRSTFFTT